MNTRSFMISALIAGVAIGLLGNLPLFNLVNCFLCLWVWGGGVLAVYLYRRFGPEKPDLSAVWGAGLGALAGLIGAFVGVVVFSLTSFVSMPLFGNVARLLQVEGDLPLEAANPETIMWSTFAFFILNLILYPLFGAISGAIAASVWRKQTLAKTSQSH